MNILWRQRSLVAPEIPSLARGLHISSTDSVLHTRPQPVVLCGGEGPVMASGAHSRFALALVTFNAKRHDGIHLDAQLLGRVGQEVGAEGGASPAAATTTGS